jgi:hypothetical protein
VLNTNAEQYGSSGVDNLGRAGAIDEPMQGRLANRARNAAAATVLRIWLKPSTMA